jgi:hypothetical protein
MIDVTNNIIEISPQKFVSPKDIFGVKTLNEEDILDINLENFVDIKYGENTQIKPPCSSDGPNEILNNKCSYIILTNNKYQNVNSKNLLKEYKKYKTIYIFCILSKYINDISNIINKIKKR